MTTINGIDAAWIADAANGTTFSDVKYSGAVLDYARKNGYTSDQAAAICVRVGIRLGNKFGKRKACDAFPCSWIAAPPSLTPAWALSRMMIFLS